MTARMSSADGSPDFNLLATCTKRSRLISAGWHTRPICGHSGRKPSCGSWCEATPANTSWLHAQGAGDTPDKSREAGNPKSLLSLQCPTIARPSLMPLTHGCPEVSSSLHVLSGLFPVTLFSRFEIFDKGKD